MGARFVVSDNGDNLSPKYAPETIAPAVAGNEAPSPVAIPIKATPTVPADPQEVPVTIEMIAETINAISTINCGLINSKP